eukprot:Skav226110  [mRNA]  locus=scaffold702:148968:153536:- [translate_table: standard]
MYGISFHSEKPEVREASNAMLQEVADRVLPYPGPKFLAGDWNQLPNKLEVMTALEKLGWKDVQQLAADQWRQDIMPTCKLSTRKDYIMLCPLLQRMVERVQVINYVFADHAILCACMSDVGPPEPIPRWSRPQPIVLGAEVDRAYLEFRGGSDPSMGGNQSDLGGGPCLMTAGVQTSVIQGEHSGKDQQASQRSTTDEYKALWQAHEQQVHDFLRHSGRPGLFPKQRGRACTMNRGEYVPHVHAVKPSRKGEPVLQGICLSRQMKLWFTQLRRLINLERLIVRPPVTVGGIKHRAMLWNAILRAPGFYPTFAKWWVLRPMIQRDEPALIPQQLPTQEEVVHIRSGLHRNLVQLEQMQKASIKSRLQREHRRNVNKVFKDVRGDGPAPVETLATTVRTEVVEVPDEGSVIVHSCAGFEEHRPILGDDKPLTILHMEEDQIWFNAVHHLSVGQEVSQVQAVASLPAMFDMFAQEWSKRWDRHKGRTPSEWKVIADFAEAAFAKKPMELIDMSVTRWKEHVRHKPLKAAAGLDAVTRADLLRLAPDETQRLLCLFDTIETTGSWPNQLCHGAIHSLQKREGAATVDAYRPITILPLPYRIWASLRGCEVMRFLGEYVPETMYGNVQGKSSTDMWYSMQLAVEQALLDDQPLAGGIVDVCKAFNCLPRWLLLQVAHTLGVHQRILVPWTSMLSSLERHFVIRQAVGSGLTSATGYAEGCCLSVAAMMLLNLVLHRYMTLAEPSIQMHSFVDNWEITSQHAHHVQGALARLEMFTEVLELQLDRSKSMVWAVSTAERSVLRNGEFTVVRNVADLGGHMQFSRQLTNATLVKKCKALDVVWGRLFRSSAPRRLKHRVVRCKAWPSALHSAPGVHIADATFTDLRAKAMKGLGMSKAGANPMAYLALTLHPSHDPEGYVLHSCVRALRRNASREIVAAFMPDIVQVPHRRRVPGPLGVLVTRLEALGWEWKGGCIWVDQHQDVLDLFDTPIQELLSRMRFAFQQTVGQRLSCRHGFAGLHDVDAPGSKGVVDRLDDVGRGMIHALQVGVFITADQTGAAHHVDEADRKCKFCGEVDSLYHRHWSCSATAWSRQQLQHETMEWVAHQPECTTHRGWCCVSAKALEFKKLLGAIPDTTARWEDDIPRVSTLYVFTDGSGLDPTLPAVRLVAWSWVASEGLSADRFYHGAQGGVPGQWQTVTRAETCAVISAVKYSLQHRQPMVIFSDSGQVVKRFNRLQRGEPCDDFTCDADLWSVLAILLRQAEGMIQCAHVFSHQQLGNLTGVDRWVCAGNEMADSVAAAALRSLDPHLLEVQRQAREEVSRRNRCYKDMLDHFVRVGHQSVQHGKQTFSVERSGDGTAEHVEYPCLDVQAVVRKIRFEVPRVYHTRDMPVWMDWFRQLNDVSRPVKLVSWIELLIHYQASTGCRGMICSGKGQHRTWSSVTEAATFDFGRLYRGFCQYGWNMLRLYSPVWRTIHARPSLFRISFWTSCIPIRVSGGFENLIDEYFSSHRIGVLASAKDLTRLPCALPA